MSKLLRDPQKWARYDEIKNSASWQMNETTIKKALPVILAIGAAILIGSDVANKVKSIKTSR